MSQCVVIAGGQVVPDSSVPCPPTSFLLMSPAEVQAVQWSPLNLSLEDGSVLAVAIVGVWAAAWCWRALIKTLDGADNGGSDS